MPRILLVVPTGHGVGLTSVALGLVRALDRTGVRVGFAKPIAQPEADHDGPERSTALVRLCTSLNPPVPVPAAEAEALLGDDQEQTLMEQVVARVGEAGANADVVVVEGLVPSPELTWSQRVNAALAKSLDAEVVLVAAPAGRSAKELAAGIELAARTYGGVESGRIAGVVLNKIKGGSHPHAALGVEALADPRLAPEEVNPFREAIAAEQLRVVGAVPWRGGLLAPRVIDLAVAIGASTVNAGETRRRRIGRVTLCAQGIPEVLASFQPGTLLIMPGDRDDVFIAACYASETIALAGILLTCGNRPGARTMELCRPALDRGLPVYAVPELSFPTATRVHDADLQIPIDDRERAEQAMNTVADGLDPQWVRSLTVPGRAVRMSPPAFRYALIEKAREGRKRIVLPEGDEPRTVAAAAICQKRGIARCVLLAKPERVREVAKAQGVELPADIEIIDPESIAGRYVAPLVDLRKSKGMTPEKAAEEIKDTVWVGTMMMKLGEIDGLVSGAVHTTANTISPALKVIKTRPGAALVSSVFFMCLPEQVVVYGDCAVNPNPTAEELADIAIQSADSAIAFGIPARVAMISYSTGTSGAGADVEKVATATKLAQERRPDLAIDGPLQYDAAVIPSVAKSKAPNSPVAGKATVFIFPDLNTGNTTYKAVQRSANCISIGPMLQGLNAPVNDLSRGCLVEDIVFTIAITAIQAMQGGPAKAANGKG
jgi:phosphate acetyltransferase